MISIFTNEYFNLYVLNNNELHMDSTSEEIQMKYQSNDVLSQEEKLEKMDSIMLYFYNFWILAEQQNKTYTMHFNTNLLLIDMPLKYYYKIKELFESLKDIFNKCLIESTFKVENKKAKMLITFILSIYKPVKPITVI